MTAQPSGSVGAAVAALIRAANIELIPLRGTQENLNVVPAGTKITITCSPKFGLGRTLEYAELAVRAGYEVVPHLAARQVAGKAELRDVVRRIDDLGITDLYVIGGDADEPAGGYRAAAEIHGALLDALWRKQAYATYMVSQLCFDAKALIRWAPSHPCRRDRAAAPRRPRRC
jgi:methylenetetrahydrofolate reductase (NADPH)